MTHHRPSDWSIIVQSAIAGAVSVAITLPVCQLAAHASTTLAKPGWNAGIGVIASSATYVPTFIGISLYRAKDHILSLHGRERVGIVRSKIVHGLKFLGVQEICEYIARFSLHVALMMGGFRPWAAAAIASGVTGFLGRLATPWFSRIFDEKRA